MVGAVGLTNKYLKLGVALVAVLINTIDDFDYQGKTVILRVDINSPLDPETKKIVNENRMIRASLPTGLNKGPK